MAAYPTVTSVLQGVNVNQVLENGYLLSGAQPSLENYGSFKNIQLNGTVVGMPSEYRVTNVNNRVIIKHPAVGQPNASNVNYFSQNNNFLSTSNINLSNIVVQGNGPTGFIASSSHLNQTTGNICDNKATKRKEGDRNIHQEGSSSNVNNYVQISPCGNVVRTITVPALNLVKLNNDKKEKIGNLKIHMSESFLPGTIVSYKGILDLNFMRNLFEITNVDISFVNDIPFEPGICDALKQIIHNNLLQDWLMLKCEEKQIQFFKVNDQIQIYCVNSFMAVLGTIAQESSLPLPFITKDSEDNTLYYYINFEKGTNDRVKKLNSLVFYDAENGRKKIPCRYPGIRLDCNFETSVAGFTIHVHESATPVYKNSVSYIRQLIIYGHIVWGFLQAWILNVREHYNNVFCAADICKNLILNQTSEINALTGNDDGMMYFIGYSNFYLKFDPVLLKEIKTNFSIENFETTFACDIPIVQYYRQFILINDLHYSDALKNIILFSKKNEKIGSSATESTFLLRKKITNFKADCFQPELPSQEPQNFQQKVVSHLFNNTKSAPSNNEGTSGGVALQFQSDPRISRPELEGSSIHTRNIDNTGKEPQKPQNTANSGRPRIKTRTVNEINSLLDAPNGVGFHRVSFLNQKMLDPSVQERKEISASALVVMIEQILKRCYTTNSLVITDRDESNDPVVINKKFDEAVNKAMGRVTLESFIEKIYVELLFSFTNKTSQIILNKHIGKAIGVKYPTLKGRFLSCFENIRKESGRANKTQAGNPAASTASEPQEKASKQLLFLLSNDVAPIKPDFTRSNCLINQNSILVQTTKSVPSNFAAVAPIISGQSSMQQNSVPIISGQSSMQQNCAPIISGQSSMQQNSVPIISGQSSMQQNCAPIISGQSSMQQNSVPIISGQSSMQQNSVPIISGQSSMHGAEMEKNEMTREPLMAQKNLPARVNASKRQCPLEPYESRNKSAISKSGQGKFNRSSSSARTENSNRTKIPAGYELSKKACVFDFNVNNDREIKVIPNVPPRVSVSSNTFRRSEEPKVATVNPSVVQNVSNGSKKNIFEDCSVNPQCQDKQTIMKTNELINAPVPVVSPLCQLKTSVDVDKATDNKSLTPDSCRDNKDSLKISFEDLPRATEEDIFHRYKLKPCSVVLNADDVSNYFKMREKENEANEMMNEVNGANEADEVYEMDSSSDASNDIGFRFCRRNCGKRDSLDEDPDFYDSVSQKGLRRRKGVSELEYMEARTRVLQRLRKRSAMYTCRTENAKMTSDELDNFFVKRNSFVGRSPYVEYSTDEDAGDGEGRSEVVEESGDSTRNKYPKKELRIMLVRLEDTLEYEKYKDSLEFGKKKSKMIRMGDKTETYYEHILNKKKHYFELIDGKLYLKEQYCVQDGVIVPADVGSGNSKPVTKFKKEPQFPENDGNFSTAFIKQENTMD